MRASMKARFAGRSLARPCGGWGTTEYIAVMFGMMGVWYGTIRGLELIREHHEEFSWALAVPY